MLAKPLNPWERRGKTLKIARNSLKRKKGKEITKKNKEKKIREGGNCLRELCYLVGCFFWVGLPS